jgi:hypothetical protein
MKKMQLSRAHLWRIASTFVTLVATEIVTAQALIVTPNPIAFADKVTNSISTLEVNISNYGAGAVNVSSLTLTGSSAFVRSGGSCPTTFPNTLQDNSSCTFSIQFTAPVTPGIYSAALAIVASTGNSVTPISASVFAPGTPPTASISTLNFGLQASGSFTPQTVSFENTTGAPISLFGIAAEPHPVALGFITNSPSYYAGGSCVNNPSPGIYTLTPELAPGQICTLEVAPQMISVSPANYDSVLTLFTSSGNTKINLKTRVGFSANALSISPSAIAFGDVSTNSNSTQTLTLTNGSVVPTTLLSIALQNLNFPLATSLERQGGTCPVVFPAIVAANSSCTVVIALATAFPPGAYSARLNINADTGNSSTTISAEVVAPGVPPTVSASTLDFGLSATGNVGSFSAQLVTFTNSGASAVNLLNLSEASTSTQALA